MRAGAADPVAGGQCVLVTALHGDIDLANSRELRDQIAAGFGQTDTVVLDCSDVTFMDCAGLRCLLELRIMATAASSTLVLAAVPPPVSRLLQLTELEYLFPTLRFPPRVPKESTQS